jgi:hypothetical protein
MPRTSLSIAATLLALGACAPREPTSPEAGLTKPIEPPRAPDLGRFPPRVTVEVYHVYVGDTIRDVCSGSSAPNGSSSTWSNRASSPGGC